jgi:hypothetical protein
MSNPIIVLYDKINQSEVNQIWLMPSEAGSYIVFPSAEGFSVASSKIAAIEQSRTAALEQGSEIVIYRADGSIEQVIDPEDDLELSDETIEALQEARNGTRETVSLDDALKELGLDE